MSAPAEHAATVREYLMRQTCSQEHHDALASVRALAARADELEREALAAHADSPPQDTETEA